MVAAFDVEFDDRYGPYLMCNPSQIPGGLVNTSVGAWQCTYVIRGSGVMLQCTSPLRPTAQHHSLC